MAKGKMIQTNHLNFLLTQLVQQGATIDIAAFLPITSQVLDAGMFLNCIITS